MFINILNSIFNTKIDELFYKTVGVLLHFFPPYLLIQRSLWSLPLPLHQSFFLFPTSLYSHIHNPTNNPVPCFDNLSNLSSGKDPMSEIFFENWHYFNLFLLPWSMDGITAPSATIFLFIRLRNLVYCRR